MESVKAPKYLYKILSPRLWKATQNRKNVILTGDDDAFIHLATEDQLEKIMEKFFPNEPQVVILRLDAAKLNGDLVYESNPGGLTKYYHLYRGFIPFESILEAKIIYRESPKSSNEQVLDIVQIGEPVLRQQARALTKEEILSPEIQKLIQDMKVTMRAAPGVGLAAPQIGRALQIAVIEDADLSHLTSEQIRERDRTVVPYHVVINPRLYIEEADEAKFFEGCLSVPHLVGVVPRAKSVRVECLNERAEPVVIKAHGWYARILQHEIDHLNATLYIDHAILPTLMTEENAIKLWKNKSIQEVVSELGYNPSK